MDEQSLTYELQLRLNYPLHKLAQRYTSIKLDNPSEKLGGGLCCYIVNQFYSLLKFFQKGFMAQK